MIIYGARIHIGLVNDNFTYFSNINKREMNNIKNNIMYLILIIFFYYLITKNFTEMMLQSCFVWFLNSKILNKIRLFWKNYCGVNQVSNKLFFLLRL